MEGFVAMVLGIAGRPFRISQIPRLLKRVQRHSGTVWGKGRAAAQVQQRRDTFVRAAPQELPTPALRVTRVPVSL